MSLCFGGVDSFIPCRRWPSGRAPLWRGYVAALVRPLGFAAGGTANSFLEIAEGPRSAPRDPAHEQRAAQSGVRIRQGGRGCGDESRERLIASADDGLTWHAAETDGKRKEKGTRNKENSHAH